MRYLTMVISCMFLVLTLLPIVSSNDFSCSKTIYVDDDNKQGPWDGTQEHPYYHIQDAINMTDNGDTVFVYSGCYNERIRIATSIVLTGEDKVTTVIDGGQKDNVVIISADTTTIKEFTIRSGLTMQSGILIDKYVRSITISDAIIRDNRYGIYAPYNTSGDILITDTIIKENLHGILSYASPVTISNNKLYQKTKGPCIELIKAADSRITDNYFSVSGDGIEISEGNNNIISYNTIILKGNDPGQAIDLNILGDNNIIMSNNISSETFRSGEGIRLEMREAPSGEPHGQIVQYNTISNLRQGIYIQYSPNIPTLWKNTITDNNFFDVAEPADFHNALGTQWESNYWGKPYLLKFTIWGTLRLSLRHSFSWRQYDRHPRLLPYQPDEEENT